MATLALFNFNLSFVHQDLSLSNEQLKPPKSFRCQTIDELALRTKSLTRLTINFGEDRCVFCGVQVHVEWDVKDFDDTWGFLCGPCGLKLSQKLTNNP